MASQTWVWEAKIGHFGPLFDPPDPQNQLFYVQILHMHEMAIYALLDPYLAPGTLPRGLWEASQGPLGGLYRPI